MKKIYTLVAAAALALGGIMYAAVGDVAFEQQGFSTVSISDGEGDGSTWSRLNGTGATTFSTQGDNIRFFATTLQAQNDWLVSPKLDLEAGKSYEVILTFKLNNASTQAEHIGLHHLTAYPTVSGTETSVDPATALVALDNVTGASELNGQTLATAGSTLTGSFTAAEGDNYVAIYVSGNFLGGFFPSAIKVVEAEAAQTPVTPIDPEEPEQPEEPVDHECTAAITGPYSSYIAAAGASGFEPGWTTLHCGGSDKVWGPATDSNFPGGLKATIGYNSTYGKDDYLCSPSIHLEKGKEYIVSFCYKTQGSDDETFTLYFSKSVDSAEEIKEGIEIAKYEKVKHTATAPKAESKLVAIPATGDYHLVFWANSEKYKYNLQIGDVKVMENVFAPGAVTGFTATPAANPTLEVALAWTLPTVDVFGNALGEDKAFEKLEIFRDDEPRAIAEFTEPVTSFTDSEETGLTSGKHTYSVIVTYAGAVSPAAFAGPTPYVGPFEPLAIPAEAPANAEFAGAWKTGIGEGHSASANQWALYKGYSENPTDPDRMRITLKVYSSASNAWAFSPEFKVEEPGFYEVEISAYLGSLYDKVYIKSFLANAQSPEAEMIPLSAIDWKDYTTSAKPQKAMVYVPVAGNYSVASQVYSTDDDNIQAAQVYQIQKVAMAAGQMVPCTVTDLKAKGAEDESLVVNLSWTNPTLSTAGTELAPGSYYTEVYRKNGSNFDLIATLTAGENTYADAVPEAGAYTYGVQTLATGTDAKMDEQPTVLSSWAGPRELPLPYSVQMNSATDANASRYIWEAIDANEDGATWGFGYADRMECAQPVEQVEGKSKYYQYDDYLLSPIFTMQPGYYELTFQMYGKASWYTNGDYRLYMNVGLVEPGFIPGRSEIIDKTLVYYNATSYTTKTLSFKVEEAGQYQIVFAADVENYEISSTSTCLGLGKVEFKYLPLLPGVATDLAVEVGADGALSAVFSWRNPSVSNIEGVEPELTQALVFRDGEQIASITEDLVPGEISSWEDDEVPTSGKHTYSVQLFTAEGTHTAAAPSVLSGWIGKGLEAPYSVEPGQYEDHGWDHHSPNMTTSYGWDTNCFHLENNNGALYEQGNQPVNGYLMTPQLEFVHTQKYKLSIQAYKTSQTDEEKENGYPVEILVCTEGTPDTWTKLGNIAVRNSIASGTHVIEFYIVGDENLAAVPVLYAAEEGEGEGEGEIEPAPEVAPGSTADASVAVPAGTQRLAFHVNNDLNNGRFMFAKFAIEHEGELVGIDAVEVAEGILIGAEGLSFDGVAENVAVYDLTGKLISFAPEAEGSVSFAGIAKGIYIVRLTLNGKAIALKVAL